MAWTSGSTRTWRRTRARILLRDGGVCQIRGPRCTGRATCVHHILGRGVSEAEADLQAACRRCNDDLGDPTALADPQPTPRTNW